MIYDCFTYNGEKDILDLRLHVLYPYVGKFIIVEFDETFSGKKKPKYLLKDYDKTWAPFIDKIDYVYITKSEYTKYKELAESSPNVPQGGPAHWLQEFCQKESIKEALTDLNDEDIVFIGDVDEIWSPAILAHLTPAKLKLKVYSYYLNNHSSEEFWGTIVSQYKDIKGECLNHMRTFSPKTSQEYGWHFTSMGGAESVTKKLTDSYTEESYASKEIITGLLANINSNKDFLGRPFNYHQDETEWPAYLRDNKAKYKHLLRNGD